MTNEDIPKWDRVTARPWDLFNSKIGRVSAEVAAERLSICKACPELIKATKQCKKCGCIMNLKVKLPHAFCPIGKWDAIEEEVEEEII
jgi:hypothetical protein